jgi:hypothetical protein
LPRETTMQKALFEATELCLDEIDELLEDVLEGEPSANLREALAKLGRLLGKGYSVGLTVMVDVFDQAGEKSLPLLSTGLAASDGQAPYRTWGDSSPQRYVVEGQMLVVPHDRCPKCWDVWDFKWKNPSCSHCGAALGKNVRILLDTDTCPFCEEGKVTAASPRCNNCGYQVDPSSVVWG